MNLKDEDIGRNPADSRAREKGFQERFEEYKSQIDELQNRLNSAEDSINKAQERAILAEDRAERAEKNQQKALQFKAEQYESLIHDLFEAPKNNLEKSINNLEKSIERQSRNSIILVTMIAIICMVISFLVVRNVYEKGLSQLAPKLDRAIKLLEENGPANGSVNADSERDSLRIILLAAVILLEKGNYNFYRTKNDVALAYKLVICLYMGNVQYREYISAFKLSGLPDAVSPTNDDELKQWDSDYISLCNKALAAIPKEGTIEEEGTIEDDGEKKYNTYKTATDTTDYQERVFPGVGTYKELREEINTRRTIFQNQLDFNTHNP